MMNVLPFLPGQISLAWLSTESQTLVAWGNVEILQSSLLAIFSSVQCPAGRILQAQDAAHTLAQNRQAVVGGFQSPVEKEMLTVLLRGGCPLVICPARGLEGMRLPPVWQAALRAGQMLLLTKFPGSVRRATQQTVHARNRLVTQLASEVLVIHAQPGGKIAALVQEIRAAGKPVRSL